MAFTSTTLLHLLRHSFYIPSYGCTLAPVHPTTSTAAIPITHQPYVRAFVFPSGCCKHQLLPITYYMLNVSDADIMETPAQATKNLNSALSCKTHVSHTSQSCCFALKTEALCCAELSLPHSSLTPHASLLLFTQHPEPLCTPQSGFNQSCQTTRIKR